MFTQYVGMTFDASGDLMTRGTFVYDKDTNLIWDVPAIAHTGAYAALSPDGASVYPGAGQTLTTARLADKTMLSRTPIPLSAERLFVAPNGQWLLAFQNTNGARVTRVDLH